jgi:hypothetical protein
MNRTTVRAVLIVLALVAAVLATAFPRLNDVETGKSSEYPDLKPRIYDVAPDRVYAAAREALAASSGWKVTGYGFGPQSWSVQALRTLAPVPFRFEVDAKLTREGKQTKVSVRSRSKWGKWDLGQNARNIREFYRLLDERLGV